jgi:predicted metalloprotease with PDZ domain
MISYRIAVADPHAHLYRVTLKVPQPEPQQRLSLPVWIPGSYMVREFARQLSAFEAMQGTQPLALEQLDKTSWLARCSGSAALEVSYLVYAFDTSVRTAFLDAERGFFNGTSLCLRVEGREHETQRIELAALPRGWQVATAMRALKPDANGRGVYEAADYDELVDHPFELGRFWRGEFTAAGVPHEFVVAGAWSSFDGERLLADAKRICEAEIAFWHGTRGAKPGSAKVGKPPFERYVFMLNAVDDGYGGLEHRASTALIAARRDLPRAGQKDLSDGYVTLLGLISHEYFHTWNVKRLKPAELSRIDYTRENHTQLLWFFEGFTSYYDDLLLLRAGLIDAPRYLKLLGKAVSGVLGAPGRRVQSVAQSSFDAWTKYYRQDENTPNATVSYYTKGSLVALALDLTLRSGGHGSTLDDVMRALWAASGGGPISEADIAQALHDAAGRPLQRELQQWVHGTDDLPLPALLEAAGVSYKGETATFAQRVGLRVSEGALTGVQVKSVLRGSAAESAGLSPGDEMLAVDGWRVRRLDDALQWLAPKAKAELLVVRDGRVITLQMDTASAGDATGAVALGLADKPSAAPSGLRRAWLGA